MPTVDLTDLSHSYPFLHLSRKLGVPYEHVLTLAAHYDRGTLKQPPKSADRCYAIWCVCHAPWRWDMARAGERGL